MIIEAIRDRFQQAGFTPGSIKSLRCGDQLMRVGINEIVVGPSGLVQIALVNPTTGEPFVFVDANLDTPSLKKLAAYVYQQYEVTVAKYADVLYKIPTEEKCCDFCQAHGTVYKNLGIVELDCDCWPVDYWLCADCWKLRWETRYTREQTEEAVK